MNSIKMHPYFAGLNTVEWKGRKRKKHECTLSKEKHNFNQWLRVRDGHTSYKQIKLDNSSTLIIGMKMILWDWISKVLKNLNN